MPSKKPKPQAIAKGVRVTQSPRLHPKVEALKALPKEDRKAVLGEMVPGKGYKFKKGNPGGGRPKGSVGGRARALGWLDSILEEHQVKVSVKRALRKYALTKPIKFYKEIVMPLVPKEVLTKTEGERKLAVRITFGGQPKMGEIVTNQQALANPNPSPDPNFPPSLPPSKQVTASDPANQPEYDGEVVAEHLNPRHPGRKDTE